MLTLKMLTWTLLETIKCCIKVHYFVSQKSKHHKILFIHSGIVKPDRLKPTVRIAPSLCDLHSLSSNLSWPFPPIAGHQLSFKGWHGWWQCRLSKHMGKGRLGRKIRNSIILVFLWKMNFAYFSRSMEKSWYLIVSFTKDFRTILFPPINYQTQSSSWEAASPCLHCCKILIVSFLPKDLRYSKCLLWASVVFFKMQYEKLIVHVCGGGQMKYRQDGHHLWENNTHIIRLHHSWPNPMKASHCFQNKIKSSRISLHISEYTLHYHSPNPFNPMHSPFFSSTPSLSQCWTAFTPKLS